MTNKELVVTDEHRAAAASYPITVRPDELDGGFVAEVPDWPMIVGAGELPDEAVAEAVEFVAAALAWAAEADQVTGLSPPGHPVP